MPAFPINEAQLVALFMQSVAYGMHVVSFGSCVMVLLRRMPDGAKRPVNWTMLMTAVILFGVGTADVSFNLYHNLVAFVLYNGPGGSEGEFEHISNWVNVMRTVWLVIEFCISDAVLIFRCWVVYSRRWTIIAFPVLLWLGVFVASIMQCYYTAATTTNSTLLTQLQVQPLIVYRIWKVDREMTQMMTKSRTLGFSNRSAFSHAIRIIVESALLYSCSVFVTFVTDWAGSNAIYGVSDVALEMAGFCFDLIIIRVSQGTSIEQ
ncbi:hypothetical protein B0H21DRAFT_673137, partial [Amylocystis lapponica]